MINELLKPLLLETQVAKPSEGELLLTLRGGRGFLLFSLTFICLVLLFMNLCFEKYEITCKSKSANIANECLLRVKHFFFTDKRTIYLGQLKGAQKKFYGFLYKSGNFYRKYNIILESDSGVIPLFSVHRTESVISDVPYPDISTKINSYIGQHTNNQLKINDPDIGFLYFFFSLITFFSMLSLYNALFLNRISILINKNTHSVTVDISNSFRTKKSNYPLPDIEQFIVQKKRENIIYRAFRALFKSDEEQVDVSELQYKSFKMKRMHDKAKSSGEEYKHQKGFLFAVYMVLKTNHVMQLTSFHFLNRKELLKAIDELNKFLA